MSSADRDAAISDTASSPEEGDGPGLTLWLTHTSARFASDLTARLHGMNVDVRLWNGPLARMRSPAAQPVAIFEAGQGRTAPRRAPPKNHRGGLAPGALRRVRDHIETAIAEKLESRALARLIGLSDCHFSRAFRQSVGIPPHRYVTLRRVEIASRLIEQTDRLLTEIALEVGFADQSHFTRAFARLKGETPGSYRRRHR